MVKVKSEHRLRLSQQTLRNEPEVVHILFVSGHNLDQGLIRTGLKPPLHAAGKARAEMVPGLPSLGRSALVQSVSD